MLNQPHRRGFLQSAVAAAAVPCVPFVPEARGQGSARVGGEFGFEISLSELSFARALEEKKIDHLDFAKIAKTELQISAVEYASRFFRDQAEDQEYLDEMNKRAAEHGVRQLLVVVDCQGRIGDADPKQRRRAVQNHRKWIDVAKSLACHSIQVNPVSFGQPEQQKKRVVESLKALSEYGAKQKMNILLGDYGGPSQNAAWMLAVIKAVNSPFCGTLPLIAKLASEQDYENLASLIPLAKGVTAQAWAFDENGQEKNCDFFRAFRIVQKAGYRGYVSIHYAGNAPQELDGIREAKTLLEKVRHAIR